MSVVIVCPLYIESEGLIKSLKLKKTKDISGYPCFANDRILLMITGTGKMNAAVSTAALLSSLKCDHFVVFGSCAGLQKQIPGSLYMIHKVTDIDTGFSWYPDMPSELSFAEASLLTGSRVYGNNNRITEVPEPYNIKEYISETISHAYSLYDMETSAYCFAASKMLGPHQIHLFRVVTDLNGQIDKTNFEKIMNEASDKILPFIKKISINKKNNGSIFLEKDIYNLFKCSVSMRHQIDQTIRYAELAGMDWKEVIEGMKEQGILPCADREKGKRALNEFTRKIAG